MDSSNGSGNVKMKFCESLDRFVAIRSYTPSQKKDLFRNVKISDKKSYRKLIINACVVNYASEIAPSIFKNDDYPLLSDIIEQELYNLCIKVNPSLDIKEITIFVEAEEENIALLDAPDKKGASDSSDDSRFLDMEDELRKRIIGQDEAVKAVSQAVRKARVGLKNPQRPVGSFVFVGQTGVGKTELAKALSAYLFEKQEVIRVDCSEYAMSHEYSKLIGAPPGYVGHTDGGYLTEAIKNQPESVVVFDEIEKAHRKVHNLLLQILDEGRLTDSKGSVVTFNQAIVILTSNTGVDQIDQLSGAIGFGGAKEAVDDKAKLRETRKALEKIFPPEFLNRIDDVILFKGLSRDENIRIMDVMLEDVSRRMQKLQLRMQLSRQAKEFLVDQGTNEKYGARPLRRAIQNHIENPLAEMILNSKLKAEDKIKVGVDRKAGSLKFQVVSDEKTESTEDDQGADHAP